MRALAILALLAILAPFASEAGAQSTPLDPPAFTVFVEDPGRAFIPGSLENLTVRLTYAPPAGARPAPAPTAERPENVEATRIAFAVKQQPRWVTNVTFEPPEYFIQMTVRGPGDVTQSSYIGAVTATLAVAPDAPALERESFIVTATADPNGNIQGATAESPDTKLRATTVGLLNVSAEPTMVLPGGRWTSVPFSVRNDGNSDIVAKVNVTVRPENSQVEFIDTLELKRNETKTVEVRVRTPWTNAELGTLELEAVPIVEGEEGPSARAEVAVRGESAVPGPGGLAALALLAGVALLARRR